MVDLVKIRKKAKEKAQETAGDQQPAPAPPAAVTSPDPEPEIAEPEQPVAPEREQPVVPQPVETARSEPSRAAAPKKKGKTPEPKSKTAVESKTEDGALESTPASAAGTVAHTSTKLETFKNQAGTQRFGTDAAAADSSDEALRELLTFSLASENYAIDIESIVEITPPREVTRIPNAEASVIGIISLRGTIVTVLDLRQILGHSPLTGGGEDARIIVLERKGQTSGILVDRVFRVAKVGPREIESHPVVSPAEHDAAIEGVFHHKGVLTIVLNLERLLKS
ncbi:MAG: chemotaxis protein CheW [Thermoanaerobaculia bacterium]